MAHNSIYTNTPIKAHLAKSIPVTKEEQSGDSNAMPPPPPPTLGYNTEGCLRVHYCLYFVTVQLKPHNNLNSHTPTPTPNLSSVASSPPPPPPHYVPINAMYSTTLEALDSVYSSLFLFVFKNKIDLI